MKKILTYITVAAFLFVFLSIRVVGLENSPLSLNFDEAGLGYNAYSIMLTGKDEYGTPWPISLRSFNDYKPALYAYLTVPFIYFGGLNQTTVRLVSAVFGTIALFFLLLIFKQISGISLFKSILIIGIISFLPWRLHFSRVAFESNLAMAFFTGAFWCLMNFEKKRIYKIGTITFSLLSIYAYHNARLAIPLLYVMVFLDPLQTGFKDIIKNPLRYIKKLWPLALVLIMYSPIFLASSSNAVLRRFDQTNIFSHYFPYAPKELLNNKAYWFNILPSPAYYLGGWITSHLMAYLSPKNLALSIYPWVIKSAQSISGTGMIGWLGGLLFIMGIPQWLKFVTTKMEYRLIVYWIIAAIAPAAVTWELFHPLRSLNVYPAIEVIIGLGIVWLIRRIDKLNSMLIRYSLLASLTVIFIVSSVYNTLNEFNYSIWDTNGEFQPGGYKEGAPLLSFLKDKYKVVYLDSPHAQNYAMFLFYMKYPPERIHKYAQARPPMGTEGFINFDFDNFVYKKYDWVHDKNKSNFVYWTSSEVIEKEISEIPGAKLYKIYDPLGRWAASIITKD